jgi:hypothetical protein
MAVQALRNDDAGQLGLYEAGATHTARPARSGPSLPDHRAFPAKTADAAAITYRSTARPCVACRAKEARYGFREADRPNRPRTLCFECFRTEINRRQAIEERLARGWNATQADLPLAETLHELSLRRRRAQIAARRALGPSCGS